MGYSALGAPLRCGWHAPALVIMMGFMRQLSDKMSISELSALHRRARKTAEKLDCLEASVVECINRRNGGDLARLIFLAVLLTDSGVFNQLSRSITSCLFLAYPENLASKR